MTEDIERACRNSQELQPGRDYPPELKEKMQEELERRMREQGLHTDTTRGR